MKSFDRYNLRHNIKFGNAERVAIFRVVAVDKEI